MVGLLAGWQCDAMLMLQVHFYSLPLPTHGCCLPPHNTTLQAVVNEDTDGDKAALKREIKRLMDELAAARRMGAQQPQLGAAGDQQLAPAGSGEALGTGTPTRLAAQADALLAASSPGMGQEVRPWLGLCVGVGEYLQLLQLQLAPGWWPVLNEHPSTCSPFIAGRGTAAGTDGRTAARGCCSQGGPPAGGRAGRHARSAQGGVGAGARRELG